MQYNAINKQRDMVKAEAPAERRRRKVKRQHHDNQQIKRGVMVPGEEGTG